MRKDADLCKRILEIVAEKQTIGGFSSEEIIVEGHTPEEISYNILMLLDQGFIRIYDKHTCSTDTCEKFMIARLSNSGDEFLMWSSDKARWEQAKKIAAKAGEVSLFILQAILVDLAKKQIWP